MLPWRHWWARLGCCGGKVTVLVVWKMIAGGVVPSQAPANGGRSDRTYGSWRLYELCDDKVTTPHHQTPFHPLSSPTPESALRPAPSTRCSPERPPAGARSVPPACRPSPSASAADSLPQLQAPSSTSPARPRASSTPAETLPAPRRRWPWLQRPARASSRCQA